MKITDLLSMCLRNLWRRKTRTFLTVFGVIIGTCSIVVMMSLGVGMMQQNAAYLENMGDLTIITVSQAWSDTGAEVPDLNADAVTAFKEMPEVTAATPFQYTDIGYSEVLHLDGRYKFQGGSVYAVDMMALEALGYTVRDGRMPQEGDPKNIMLFGDKVAYQFQDMKRKRNNMIYPEADPITGEIPDPFFDPLTERFSINIRNNETDTDYDKIPQKLYDDKVRCIGILQPGDSYDYQLDKEYAIYIDVSYAEELQAAYNKENNIRTETGRGGRSGTTYNQVYVKASSIDTVSEVEDAIKEMGFSTYSMNSVRDSIMEQMMTIQLVLGGLGAISMFVAALSITNTMVMSIYERTREIGVMKVIGCKLGNIRALFLTEAGMIGLIGGLLGILISFGISVILNITLAGAGGNYGDSSSNLSVIPFWLVLLGMGFAVGVGLLAGFSPANRAVKISALEAIKHD